MRPLYIFDLDGTLALIEHRLHYVQRPSLACCECGGANWSNCVQCADLDEGFEADWPSFFAACKDDKPNTPVISVMEMLKLFADIWIFSGRSDEAREDTITWLTQHTSFDRAELEGPIFMMRQAGDYTPDEELKKQWLDRMLLEDRSRLVAVFDDRARVVRMWRKAGITCFQVAPGDF